MQGSLSDLERRRWEKQVVSRAQRGDPEAFGELYDAYARQLYAQVLLPRLKDCAAAEDALADTFRAALQGVARYQTTESSVLNWLSRIAKNKAIDVQRARAAQGRRERRLEREIDSAQSAPRGPEQLLGEATLGVRRRGAVQEALAQLNPRYRRALELRFLQELPRDRCAELLEVKVATFDVLLLRSLRAFRKHWDQLAEKDPALMESAQ